MTFSKYLSATNRNNYKRRPDIAEKKCSFCDQLSEKRRIIFMTKNFFIAPAEFPYNVGHIMICTKRHVIKLSELNEEENKEIFSVIKNTLEVLERAYNTPSFNVGVNLGAPAGATYEHLHFHIVPRWVGDSGFMELTASTRVLKETADETVNKLRKMFEEI